MKSACAIITSLALLVASSVRADTSPETNQARRRAGEHFQRGVELYEHGDLDAAATEFGRAYDLAPNVMVLFNLAGLRGAQGDYPAAIKLYEQFLAAADPSVPHEQLQHAREQVAAFQQHVARLWVGGSVQEGELLVDGRKVATLPMDVPVLVNVGSHRVELRSPGLPSVVREIELVGNETVRLELPMTTVVASTPPSASNAPFWVSLVSALALTGGAVTFGVMAQGSKHALDQHLAQIPADRARVAEARSELRRDALLSDSLAVAALIAGGFSLFFALSSDDDAPAPGTRLGVLPGGGRFQLTHSF